MDFALAPVPLLSRIAPTEFDQLSDDRVGDHPGNMQSQRVVPVVLYQVIEHLLETLRYALAGTLVFGR